MPLSTIERLLPWTGALAGVAWVAQDAVANTSLKDAPDAASARIINDHLGANYLSQGLLVIMGIALLFFATAIRNLLRSGEGREATYSSIAHAGWLVTAAAAAQMVMIGWALINGAADSDDQAGTQVLGYLDYFSWAGFGVGLATAFIATGFGGISAAVLPKWFAVASIVMGVLTALGNAGIPPGGLVAYLGMPVWLVAASIIVSRRQRAAATVVSRPATT